MDTFGQNINNEMNLTVMNTGLSSRPLLTSTLPLAAILIYLDNLNKFTDYENQL